VKGEKMSDLPKGITEEDRKIAKKSFLRANWALLILIIVLIAAIAVLLVLALK